MNYSFSTGQGLINPPENIDTANSLTLEDVYQLTIEIDEANKKIVVKEVGGRILLTKYKWKLNYADVHMYPDGSLCLCPQPEVGLLFYQSFSLQSFFYNYLIPNLYYHTYLNKFGKEPWKSSNHGEAGILESYTKSKFSEIPIDIVVDSYVETLSFNVVNLITSTKKIDQNLLCVCGSGKRFKDCHPYGFMGLKKLHEDYWIYRFSKNRSS